MGAFEFGAAYASLVNVWDSVIDDDYFYYALAGSLALTMCVVVSIFACNHYRSARYNKPPPHQGSLEEEFDRWSEEIALLAGQQQAAEEGRAGVRRKKKKKSKPRMPQDAQQNEKRRHRHHHKKDQQKQSAAEEEQRPVFTSPERALPAAEEYHRRRERTLEGGGARSAAEEEEEEEERPTILTDSSPSPASGRYRQAAPRPIRIDASGGNNAGIFPERDEQRSESNNLVDPSVFSSFLQILMDGVNLTLVDAGAGDKTRKKIKLQLKGTALVMKKIKTGPSIRWQQKEIIQIADLEGVRTDDHPGAHAAAFRLVTVPLEGRMFQRELAFQASGAVERDALVTGLRLLVQHRGEAARQLAGAAAGAPPPSGGSSGGAFVVDQSESAFDRSVL
mmetsp:Transcript_38203/g.66292  ORF Transcript_38203/g.66292 Transcript_38203/m.66292 type:complete len:392 (-) Transcript_38203:295-1470(-)